MRFRFTSSQTRVGQAYNMLVYAAFTANVAAPEITHNTSEVICLYNHGNSRPVIEIGNVVRTIADQ